CTIRGTLSRRRSPVRPEAAGSTTTRTAGSRSPSAAATAAPASPTGGCPWATGHEPPSRGARPTPWRRRSGPRGPSPRWPATTRTAAGPARSASWAR
ncbi:unnamed protein product, partial [Prorocentrum cordatum]